MKIEERKILNGKMDLKKAPPAPMREKGILVEFGAKRRYFAVTNRG